MYAVAVERLGFDPVSLVIHDLDVHAGGRHVVQNDERERDEFAKQLKEWVYGIRSGRFNAAEDAKTCAVCDFRWSCAEAPEVA